MAVPVELTPPPPRAPRRPARLRRKPPPLDAALILAWADHEREQTGRYPRCTDGPVRAAAAEKWKNLDAALRDGHRGLPGGDTLARLLARERGVRNHSALPALSAELILAWADSQRRQTGRWPRCTDGPVQASPDETWHNLDSLLRVGGRGLPGGDSLPKLLERERGVRNIATLPDFSEEQVAAWAKSHRERTGRLPYCKLGAIHEAPGETWACVERALRDGTRGFPGGDTLARFVARHLGVRNNASAPRLMVEQILEWADRHHERMGRWPVQTSGAVVDAPGETWLGIHCALREGLRGLPGGSSLVLLLVQRRGVRSKGHAPRLTVEQILAWADAHRQRTGRWPGMESGPVHGVVSETWAVVEVSLREGLRGLPGGDTLYQLLRRERGARRAGRNGSLGAHRPGSEA